VEVTKDTKLTSTPTISESDKVALFERASTYYLSGKSLPPEILKSLSQSSDEAKLKIRELGLSFEFQNYENMKESQRIKDLNAKYSNIRPPLPTQPMGDYSRGTLA
jgi:hypothetical protein